MCDDEDCRHKRIGVGHFNFSAGEFEPVLADDTTVPRNPIALHDQIRSSTRDLMDMIVHEWEHRKPAPEDTNDLECVANLIVLLADDFPVAIKDNMLAFALVMLWEQGVLGHKGHSCDAP